LYVVVNYHLYLILENNELVFVNFYADWYVTFVSFYSHLLYLANKQWSCIPPAITVCCILDVGFLNINVLLY